MKTRSAVSSKDLQKSKIASPKPKRFTRSSVHPKSQEATCSSLKSKESQTPAIQTSDNGNARPCSSTAPESAKKSRKRHRISLSPVLVETVNLSSASNISPRPSKRIKFSNQVFSVPRTPNRRRSSLKNIRKSSRTPKPSALYTSYIEAHKSRKICPEKNQLNSTPSVGATAEQVENGNCPSSSSNETVIAVTCNEMPIVESTSVGDDSNNVLSCNSYNISLCEEINVECRESDIIVDHLLTESENFCSSDATQLNDTFTSVEQPPEIAPSVSTSSNSVMEPKIDEIDETVRANETAISSSSFNTNQVDLIMEGTAEKENHPIIKDFSTISFVKMEITLKSADVETTSTTENITETVVTDQCFSGIEETYVEIEVNSNELPRTEPYRPVIQEPLSMISSQLNLAQRSFTSTSTSSSGSSSFIILPKRRRDSFGTSLRLPAQCLTQTISSAPSSPQKVDFLPYVKTEPTDPALNSSSRPLSPLAIFDFSASKGMSSLLPSNVPFSAATRAVVKRRKVSSSNFIKRMLLRAAVNRWRQNGFPIRESEQLPPIRSISPYLSRNDLSRTILQRPSSSFPIPSFPLQGQSRR